MAGSADTIAGRAPNRRATTATSIATITSMRIMTGTVIVMPIVAMAGSRTALTEK